MRSDKARVSLGALVGVFVDLTLSLSPTLIRCAWLSARDQLAFRTFERAWACRHIACQFEVDPWRLN